MEHEMDFKRILSKLLPTTLIFIAFSVYIIGFDPNWKHIAGYAIAAICFITTQYYNRYFESKDKYLTENTFIVKVQKDIEKLNTKVSGLQLNTDARSIMGRSK